MSDLKPSSGYATIEEEFEDRTAKAFRQGADYIVIHSRRQQFQAEAASYCLSHGWLTEPEWIEAEQYRGYRYRLTPEGRKRWLPSLT